MKTKSALVTGAAGFICSHLIPQLLEQGWEVCGIDNFDNFYSREAKEANLALYNDHPNFNFAEADICDRNFWADLRFRPDVVIHFAAKAGVLPSLKDPEGYIQTNIFGTSLLLEWMRQQERKKLVFASSSSVYGNNEKVPFSENDSVDAPISPYAFTKKSCELMNHSFHHLYGIDCLNLRLFTVYGPRQRPDLAIHKFCKLIDADQQIEMYGDGSTARDYTFVEDTVQGILSAISYLAKNDGVFETVNLGNKQPIRLQDLITHLYKAMGKEPKVKEVPMKAGDVNLTYADIKKAEELLNYQPQVSFETGIQRFLNWHGKS